MAFIAHLDRDGQLHERITNPHTAAERSARAAQKLVALGEMTGGIAHDVRNILAVVESGLRIAERTNEPEKLRVGIAAAREGIDRGTILIAQLLNFAKQQELGIQPVNTNELLRTLVVFLQYAAGPGIRIVFKLASDIPKCAVDRSQFGTALLNLVVNARDAMPRGGEIEISTERRTVESARSGSHAPGTYICVCVKDEGQGMSSDVMQRVFDPFFTTKGDKGTGLGLPQVCAFMQRVGGHIEVISEPGKGTAVELLFPASYPD
jgi:signal transduction histidine kinase